MAKVTSSNGDDPDIPPNAWLIRPCEVYLDEYNECASFQGRMHEKFIHGRSLDEQCQQWKEDYENCLKFRKTLSFDVADHIIAHEEMRRQTRISAAQANDVWPYRTQPPEDWMKPLPEELKNNTLPPVQQLGDKSRCVIS